jgi:hypothetical protein
MALVHGDLVSFVGRVSSDVTTVDITDVDGVGSDTEFVAVRPGSTVAIDEAPGHGFDSYWSRNEHIHATRSDPEERRYR